MSNFGTMVKRVAIDINRTTAEYGDQIRLKIIDAVNYIRDEEEYFNESTVSFTTTADQQLYAVQTILQDSAGVILVDESGNFIVDDGELPYDFIEPVGTDLFFQIDSDPNNYYPIQYENFISGDRYRFDVGDVVATYPQAAYFTPEGLYLIPAPGTSTHTVKFRFKRRFFTPGYTYDSTADTFSFDSDNTASGWFDVFEAERLTRLCSMWFVYRDVIRDQVQTNIAFHAFNTELKKYRTQDTKKRGSGYIEPHGLY